MNILFDGNYLYHRNFSIFSTYYKDEDIGTVLQDKEKQQVLLRKCIIDLCYTVRKFENVERVVVVIDSHSWRYGLYEDYKYALTRVREPYYKEFLAVLQQLEELLRSRGVIVSRVNGAEGDDLLYVWSIYFGYILDQETVIVTGDSDLRQIITKNVSLFNNNSKNLKLYCLQEKEVYWNEKMESDVQVQVTNPFEVLLYKVIMGDGSDNIIKLKNGFGNKAFEKFIKYITNNDYQIPIQTQTDYKRNNIELKKILGICDQEFHFQKTQKNYDINFYKLSRLNIRKHLTQIRNDTNLQEKYKEYLKSIYSEYNLFKIINILSYHNNLDEYGKEILDIIWNEKYNDYCDQITKYYGIKIDLYDCLVVDLSNDIVNNKERMKFVMVMILLMSYTGNKISIIGLDKYLNFKNCNDLISKYLKITSFVDTCKQNEKFMQQISNNKCFVLINKLKIKNVAKNIHENSLIWELENNKFNKKVYPKFTKIQGIIKVSHTPMINEILSKYDTNKWLVNVHVKIMICITSLCFLILLGCYFINQMF